MNVAEHFRNIENMLDCPAVINAIVAAVQVRRNISIKIKYKSRAVIVRGVDAFDSIKTEQGEERSVVETRRTDKRVEPILGRKIAPQWRRMQFGPALQVGFAKKQLLTPSCSTRPVNGLDAASASRSLAPPLLMPMFMPPSAKKNPSVDKPTFLG